MNSEKSAKKVKKLKKGAMNVIFAVAGAIIGEVVAFISKNVSFLSWLGYKVNLGITSPIEINLIIVKFNLGFYFVFCPALVIFIILALAFGNIMFIRQSQNKNQ